MVLFDLPIVFLAFCGVLLLSSKINHQFYCSAIQQLKVKDKVEIRLDEWLTEWVEVIDRFHFTIPTTKLSHFHPSMVQYSGVECIIYLSSKWSSCCWCLQLPNRISQEKCNLFLQSFAVGRLIQKKVREKLVWFPEWLARYFNGKEELCIKCISLV